MINYYKTLGIEPNSSKEDIKKAYRQLALRFHPDKNPNDPYSEAIFKSITEAYEKLMSVENTPSEKAKDDNSQEKNYTQTNTRKITPKDIFDAIQIIREKIIKLQKDRVSLDALFERLTKMLSDNVVNFLLAQGNIRTNNSIIDEVLLCFKVLKIEQVETLAIKLVKLAGSDNEKISLIANQVAERKNNRYLKGYSIPVFIALITLFLYFGTDFFKKFPRGDNTQETPVSIENGNLNNTFVDTGLSTNRYFPNQTSKPVISLTPEEKLKNEREQLKSEGWEEKDLKNGILPTCYNFIPKKSKIDNYLEVQVGGGTDAAIKLMNIATDKCIRYVFINSGTSYKIKNIPEGRYYVKIAYGLDWISKVENGNCIGKFLRNSLYEKGEDIMDFNIKYFSDNRYSIPYYELKLDVISSFPNNTFDSEKISEDSFNQ